MKEITNKEILRQREIRPLCPDDYEAWVRVAESAWGIRPINQSYDYDAIVSDNVLSLGIHENGTLVGASINILKIDSSGTPYLLVHQLGVEKNRHDSGLGQQLLTADLDLVRNGIAKGAEKLKLTSDPLVSRNVRLYLKKGKLHSNTYIKEAYKGLEQIQTVRSDRLYYVSQPNSAWSQEGIVLPDEAYARLLAQEPRVCNLDAQLPIQLVEIPLDLSKLLSTNKHVALAWQDQLARILPNLYEAGYTAVDHALISDSTGTHSYIVCLREYDENDPTCLLRQYKNLTGGIS